jgi:hypothetical protein
MEQFREDPLSGGWVSSGQGISLRTSNPFVPIYGPTRGSNGYGSSVPSNGFVTYGMANPVPVQMQPVSSTPITPIPVPVPYRLTVNVRNHCKASSNGCNIDHTHHYCNICHDTDSSHCSDNCPDIVNRLLVRQALSMSMPSSSAPNTNPNPNGPRLIAQSPAQQPIRINPNQQSKILSCVRQGYSLDRIITNSETNEKYEPASTQFPNGRKLTMRKDTYGDGHVVVSEDVMIL